MAEGGVNSSRGGDDRQPYARQMRPSQRSYYVDAFQSSEESSYQRLQQDASRRESPYQQQMQAQQEDVRAHRSLPVVEPTNPVHNPASRVSADALPRIEERPQGQRRSTLRRETVSSLGYELGQSNRPSSFVNDVPLDEGYSYGSVPASHSKGSWGSSGGAAAAGQSDKKGGIALGVVVVAIVVVVLVLVAVFGVRV